MEKTQQTESLDQETRNQIWNLVHLFTLDSWDGYPHSNDHSSLKVFYETMWAFYFKLPLDEIMGFEKHSPDSPFARIKKVILNDSWNDAFDLLEYIIQSRPENETNGLVKTLNKMFETESVSYRIIDNLITPITHPIEIQAINDALNLSPSTARLHLQSALSLISDKENPDYRNSIKESISAVESICKLISGDEKGTLGKCLSKITKSHPVPSSLKSALDTLYGYTSNEGGIRHALTEDGVTPTFADAKFMLVSCTAFVNYLLTIAAEKSISLETNTET